MAKFPSQQAYENFNATAIQELGFSWVDGSTFDKLMSGMYERKDPDVDQAIKDILKCTSEFVNAIKDPPAAENFQM